MSLMNRNKQDIANRTQDPFFQSMDKWMNTWRDGWPQNMTDWQGEQNKFYMPNLEVSYQGDKAVVTAELPGLNEDDIHIHLEQDTLVIEGEKKMERSEEKGGRHYSERQYGHFKRAVQIPFDVDQERVCARFKKGILSVELLKAPQAKDKARRISISE